MSSGARFKFPFRAIDSILPLAPSTVHPVGSVVMSTGASEGVDILNAHGSTGYRRAADQSDPGFRQQIRTSMAPMANISCPEPFIFATDPLVESLSVADMDEDSTFDLFCTHPLRSYKEIQEQQEAT